jgi:transposase
VTLIWLKRIWRRRRQCTVVSCLETSEAITQRASLTERARARAALLGGRNGESVTAVTRDFGVGWSTIMWRPRPRPTHWSTTRSDSPACGRSGFGRDRVHRRHRHQADRVRHRDRGPDPPPDGAAQLLDVVESRSAAALSGWIAQREPGWRATVTTASLDPYRGYAAALRTGLPGAVRVLDAFHVTPSGSPWSTKSAVRPTEQVLTGHGGRRDDPLYRIRRLLRRGYDHHSPLSLGAVARRVGRRGHPR